MQYCKVTIDIGGDQLNSLCKKVAVSEIPILEKIHGETSVKVLAVLGEKPVEPRKELDRLRSHYTGRDERGVLFVDVLYANAIGGKLPQTLLDINRSIFDSQAASQLNVEDEALDAIEDPLDFRTEDEVRASVRTAAKDESSYHSQSDELELVPPSGKKGK